VLSQCVRVHGGILRFAFRCGFPFRCEHISIGSEI
jgi:hypothetical protein